MVKLMMGGTKDMNKIEGMDKMEGMDHKTEKKDDNKKHH